MKRIKKVISIILSLCIISALFSIQVFAVDIIPISEVDGSVEYGKTYSISNAHELALFTQLSDYCYGVTIVLTADIIVNDGEFTITAENDVLYNGVTLDECEDLVTLKPKSQFSGTFDGADYIISGLYCTKSAEDIGLYESCNVGLFESCSNAKIQNVNIANSCFIGTDSVGSICGKDSRSTISNCYSDSIVISEEIAGGILGSSSGSISNCYSDSIVISEEIAGGIVGDSLSRSATIKSCFNKGNIVGGDICGGVAGRADSNFTDCGNSGNVSGSFCAGGFAGFFMGYAEGCFNTGDVYADWVAGGFAGQIGISQSFRQTSREYYIVRCYSAGDVSARLHAGNFCGECSSDFSIFESCFYKGVTGDTADGCGTIEQAYEYYLDEVDPDPWGSPTIIQYGLGVHLKDEKTPKENYRIYKKAYVSDGGNENNGYPMPKSLHRNHVWGEYELDENALTETAECICDGCEEQNVINHVHTWSEYIYNDDADCVNNGTQTAHCTNEKCTATNTQEDESHPAKGHTDGEWITSKEATYTQEGLKELHCALCDTVIDTQVIPKLLSKVESVTLNTNSVNVYYKGKTALTVKANVTGQPDYTVEWSSTNKKVAVVDENGLVTAVGIGEAEIHCVVTDSNGDSFTDTCRFTVKYSWWQWILKIVLFGWLWY